MSSLKKTTLLFSMSLAILGLLLTGTTPVEAAPKAKIQGTVLMSNGNAPTQAIVKLTDSGGNLVAQTSTSSNGSYSFRGLDPGTYTVTAQGFGGGIIGEDSATVGVSSGATVTVNLTISGTPFPPFP